MTAYIVAFVLAAIGVCLVVARKLRKVRDTVVYLVGGITGLSYDAAVKLRLEVIAKLLRGFRGMSPLRRRLELAGQTSIAQQYVGHRMAAARRIFDQNRGDVGCADIVLANFLDTPIISRGSIVELAWAYLWGKWVVVVMDDANVHNHPWVHYCAHYVVRTVDESMVVIAKLKGRRPGLPVVDYLEPEIKKIKDQRVVVVDFLDETAISIPKIMQCAWAFAMHKMLFILMQPGNPNDHVLVRECTGYIEEDRAKAEGIIEDLEAYV